MALRTAAIGALAAGLAVTLAACAKDEVKEQWESRATFPSCGTVTLSVNDGPIEEVGGEKVTCLKEAFGSGKAAELEVRFSTQEGDPVVEYYRVTDKGTTEHYTDSTKDPNSDQKWSYGNCATPENAFDGVC